MSRIGGRNTKPEMLVRSLLHGMGYRFRVHRKDLPGKPDITLPRHKKVILVHGCFWHGHEGCPRSNRPGTNVEFWNKKIAGNIERDKNNLQKLKNSGWKCLILWTCEIKDQEALKNKLIAFLETHKHEQDGSNPSVKDKNTELERKSSMLQKHSKNGYTVAIPGIEQKTLVYGERTLMTEFLLKKGSLLPQHSHPHEQTGYLVSGHIRLLIGERENDVMPGDSWCIPGNVEHQAEILEDSVAIEVFSPVREEYLPRENDPE